MPAQIAVLGAGSWGTALSVALCSNKHRVMLWARSSKHAAAMLRSRSNEKYLAGFQLPNSLEISSDLTQVAKTHTTFLVCVPSHAFRQTLQQLSKLGVSGESNIVWATKGFDAGLPKADTPVLLSSVVAEELGTKGLHAVISGPSFSKEVAAGLPTAITASGSSPAAARFAATLFHSSTMRVYTNTDLVGVQLGGAVKNVIAIAAGISDGLGFGANARTAIITRGLAEIARLGSEMGAAKDTFLGLAGMGDLVLTCTDNQSRNRQFGLSLGGSPTKNHGSDSNFMREKLNKIGQEVEGYRSSRDVFRLAKRYSVEMPIVEQVYNVLFEGRSPNDAVKSLLRRELNNE